MFERSSFRFTEVIMVFLFLVSLTNPMLGAAGVGNQTTRERNGCKYNSGNLDNEGKSMRISCNSMSLGLTLFGLDIVKPTPNQKLTEHHCVNLPPSALPSSLKAENFWFVRTRCDPLHNNASPSFSISPLELRGNVSPAQICFNMGCDGSTDIRDVNQAVWFEGHIEGTYEVDGTHDCPP